MYVATESHNAYIHIRINNNSFYMCISIITYVATHNLTTTCTVCSCNAMVMMQLHAMYKLQYVLTYIYIYDSTNKTYTTKLIMSVIM